MSTAHHANFDLLKEQVISLFPEKLAPLMVRADQQETELESIEGTIGSQRFYFVVDMRSFEIIRCRGVQRWLGHDENDFSLKRYWKMVHPGNQIASHTVFLQMARILCAGKFELEFMVQRYGNLTALRHHQGHYLLCKRIASVFQYDAENRLTEYLNEFTIVAPFKNEPLSPSFFTKTGEAETERGRIILENALANFLGMKVFSAQELQVARLLAYQPGITQQKLAAQFNRSTHTIDTYYKRFLTKARDYFHINFQNVQEAANYLRESALI
ncbi:MAG: hypothetical protein ACK4E0_07000 [Chitinophagaceae bacterium]